MNVPRLEIYLDSQQSLCVAKVEREGDARLIVEIGLTELKSSTLEVASSNLGGSISNLLSLWHKHVLDEWGIPSVEESSQSDDYDIAQRLIGKSMASKITIHVPTIHLLLSQAAGKDEGAKQFFDEAWPTIRTILESYS